MVYSKHKMKQKDAFAQYIVELLSPFGEARFRAMFGGYGIYLDSLFIAIVVDNVLYFKTNEETRGHFLDKSCKPFTYKKKNEFVSMAYYEAPPGAVDTSENLDPWVKLAIKAALGKNSSVKRRT